MATCPREEGQAVFSLKFGTFSRYVALQILTDVIVNTQCMHCTRQLNIVRPGEGCFKRACGNQGHYLWGEWKIVWNVANTGDTRSLLISIGHNSDRASWSWLAPLGKLQKGKKFNSIWDQRTHRVMPVFNRTREIVCLFYLFTYVFICVLSGALGHH